jgi:hypothetical protein
MPSSQDESMVKTGQGRVHQSQAKPSQGPQVKRQIKPTTFSIDQRTLHPIQCMHLWTDRPTDNSPRQKATRCIRQPKALQPTKLDTSTGSPAPEPSAARPTGTQRPVRPTKTRTAEANSTHRQGRLVKQDDGIKPDSPSPRPDSRHSRCQTARYCGPSQRSRTRTRPTRRMTRTQTPTRP